MVANVSNENWLQRLKHGNSTVRDAAIEELRELILRGLSTSLHNHYESRSFQAEDVVQDALIKIMNSLDRFEGRSRFTTWAMSIATRVGISSLRRKHCQDVSLDGIGAGDSLTIEVAAIGETTSGQDVDRREILKKLQELVDAVLTDRQRLAIRGLLEGLPVEEIAARTGSNRNAVYKLVHDARIRLRDGFERSGIFAADIGAIFA